MILPTPSDHVGACPKPVKETNINNENNLFINSGLKQKSMIYRRRTNN
jgi:hypothetical protein